MINSMEEFFSKHSDALIIAGGEKVLESFAEKPKCFTVLLNCPEDILLTDNTKRSEGKDDDLKIVYTGGIKVDRSLVNIAKAISTLNKIQFVIAGPIVDNSILQKMQESTKIKYKGILEPIDALLLEASSDIMIALYDPKIPWNNMTLPNKLFESMMCGIPIITNVAQEIVNERECGLTVEYDNVDNIKQTILKLRDDVQLRQNLGENGRKAFLDYYNWQIMEQRLYKICDDLLK
jgi:glycosyltransferase involved in cell wall biosynthesis